MVVGTIGKKVGNQFLAFLKNPHLGEDTWMQKIGQAAVYYRGNVADKTDENLCALTELVNEGLKQGYGDCYARAEEYATYLRTHPLYQAETSLFNGVEVAALENYLTQHQYTDVLEMLRGAK